MFGQEVINVINILSCFLNVLFHHHDITANRKAKSRTVLWAWRCKQAVRAVTAVRMNHMSQESFTEVAYYFWVFSTVNWSLTTMSLCSLSCPRYATQWAALEGVDVFFTSRYVIPRSSDSRPLAPSGGRARYAHLRLKSASSFSARFLVLRQVELHVSGEPVLVSGRVQRASDGSRMRRTETWNGWWWRCRSTTVRLHSHLHV